MTLTPPPILNYAGQSTTKERPVIRWVTRIAYAIAGVLLPITCFTIVLFWYPAGPEWQSPDLGHKVAMLLDKRVPLPFYPLLAFSATSMAMIVFKPRRWAGSFVVRIGLWTGIVLSLQYTIVQSIAVLKADRIDIALLACFVALLVGFGSAVVAWLISLIPFGRAWRAARLAIVLSIGAILIAGLIFALAQQRVGESIGVFFGVPFVVALICAPAWALAAYTWMSIRAWKLANNRSVSPVLLAALPLTWLGAYVLAWRISITLAIEEYAKLSSSQPGCYIATAAARGHSWLVHSAPTRTHDGSLFFANSQLRHLKAAEIAVAALAPRAHRVLRRIYDRLGKPAARWIAHPILADTAYLTLKPFEWISIAFIKGLLGPEAIEKIQGLYRA